MVKKINKNKVVSKKKIKKVIKNANIYIKATFNNTHITITDLGGNVLASISGGNVGFRGSRESTPYAAEVAMQKALELVANYNIEKVDIYVRGLGMARDQALKGLSSNQNNIQVNSITDITPVPHGGCRKKGVRHP